MRTDEFNAGGKPCDGLASHPGGSRNTPSRFMPLKQELSAGLMGRLWPVCLPVSHESCDSMYPNIDKERENEVNNRNRKTYLNTQTLGN